jgi:hypothetical protein
MSKNMVGKEATNDVTIWPIRAACWIIDYTHAPTRPGTYTHARTDAFGYTHRQLCNTFCVSTARTVHERASVLRYTYIASLVRFKLVVALDKPYITAHHALRHTQIENILVVAPFPRTNIATFFSLAQCLQSQQECTQLVSIAWPVGDISTELVYEASLSPLHWFLFLFQVSVFQMVRIWQPPLPSQRSTHDATFNIFHPPPQPRILQCPAGNSS